MKIGQRTVENEKKKSLITEALENGNTNDNFSFDKETKLIWKHVNNGNGFKIGIQLRRLHHVFQSYNDNRTGLYVSPNVDIGAERKFFYIS